MECALVDAWLPWIENVATHLKVLVCPAISGLLQDNLVSRELLAAVGEVVFLEGQITQEKNKKLIFPSFSPSDGRAVSDLLVFINKFEGFAAKERLLPREAVKCVVLFALVAA